MKTAKAQIVREFGPFPDTDGVHGVTYDGRHVWFATGSKIQALDPERGAIERSIDVEARAGTAFDGKHLYQITEKQIHKIDPHTGKILRTLESDRFVTEVSWLNGELWHGTWEGEQSDLRRIDPNSGAVLEKLEMPPDIGISGLESDGKDRFFCGGGNSGKLRVVRRA